MKRMPLLFVVLLISGAACSGYDGYYGAYGCTDPCCQPCNPCSQSYSYIESDCYDESDYYTQEQLKKLDNNLTLYCNLLREGERYENSIWCKIAKWVSVRPSLLVSALGGAVAAKTVLNYFEQNNKFVTNKTGERIAVGGIPACLAFVPGLIVSRAVFDRVLANPLSKLNPLRKWTNSKANKGTKYINKRLEDLKIKMKHICEGLSLETIDKSRQNWGLTKEQEEVLLDISRKIRKERSGMNCCEVL